MAPTFGVAGFAGALIVDGESLTRDAHGRLIRRCQPAVEVWHMNERVMGHSRYLCVVTDSASWDERQACRPHTAPEISQNMVAVQVSLVKTLRNVRFGSKADICSAQAHVRFTPNSDIKCDIAEWLWAKSGPMHRGKQIFIPTSLVSI